MANNYDFLFKFIIIGDSSTSIGLTSQVSANHVCYCDSRKTDSSRIMSPLLELSSDPEMQSLMILPSRYRSGIQYPCILQALRPGNNHSRPSHDPTTKGTYRHYCIDQLQHFQSTMSPNAIHSRILVDGCTRSRTTVMRRWRSFQWAIRLI